MSKYDEMSDYDVNYKVAYYMGLPMVDNQCYTPAATYRNGKLVKLVDYCNNPADMWPLLLRLLSVGVMINLSNESVNGESLNDKSISRKISELYLDSLAS